MAIVIRRSTLGALGALGLSFGIAGGAHADVVLPVQNLDFSQFNGTFKAPKTLFQTAAPTDWSIGHRGHLQ